MNKVLFIFFTLVIASFNLYGQQEDNKNSLKTSINILFIGNSLTFTNNLPKLVRENANLKGLKIRTRMIAYPNYAIEDHWNEGKTQKLISSKNYDFVIIQQGPSSQADGRKMLIEYGKKYSLLCKLNDAKLAYFMVWPSLKYYQSFNNVIKNYEDAATINNATLLPVGRIWKEHIDSMKTKKYYDTDGFHPSLEGSKVAAEIIVDNLFN